MRLHQPSALLLLLRVAGVLGVQGLAALPLPLCALELHGGLAPGLASHLLVLHLRAFRVPGIPQVGVLETRLSFARVGYGLGGHFLIALQNNRGQKNTVIVESK